MNKIIKKAVVLHKGWEMDNYAWLSQDEGGVLKLITTSHGSEYEMTKKQLLEKIEETKNSLDQLNGLFDLAN